MPELLHYTDTQSDLPILFFIHGWPDTGELWKHQVDYFSTRFRCVCVTLPGYRPGDPAGPVDFPELADRIAATVEKVKGNSPQPLTLVGHDWGAYLTYLTDKRHPHLASRLITMDVGAELDPTSFGHALFLVSYQAYLITAYFLGKALPFLGEAMTRKFSVWSRAPRGAAVTSRSNYLYFYFWRAVLLKKYRAALIGSYSIKKPLLYLYGEKKPYHFHTERWKQLVSAASGSMVVGFPRRHWFLVRDPQATNEAMSRFLG